MPPYLPRRNFPPWIPDLSDQETNLSVNVSNVVPRADGWAPIPSFVPFSAALPGPCRGFFYARNSDGSIAIFAGTADSKLYLLNNTTLTWTDVSQGGGTYGALPASGQWTFCQFNNTVIACHGNVNPQAFDLAAPTTFADLGGTPPQAAFVSVVNRFVVLSGLTASPYRIQWSDLDGITTWTAGVGQADFQDLPDGGLTRSIAGFDLYGVIFQDSMARLMTYAPGSPVIFTITKITGGDGNGLFAFYAYVIDQDIVFWISQEGFKRLSPGGSPDPTGKEVVDRFFLSNVDTSNPQLIVLTTDPAVSRLYFGFKSKSGQAGLLDTFLVFDWKLNRWSQVKFSGQWIGVFSRPGTTLEGMDAPTPGAVAITGAVAAPGGAIRLTVSPGTAGMATAAQQTVYGVWNVTQINGDAPFLAAINNKMNNANSAFGTWPISIVDGTHVDLVGSTFAGTYSSGGILGANMDLIPFSFDTVSTFTTPSLAGFDSSNRLGFFNGPNQEAVIETGEEGSNDKRFFIKGFRVITDAPSVFGSVSFRDNPQASYTYTSEVGIDSLGNCLVAGGGVDTRYARARVRIPAGTVWQYAMAVEPDATPTGSY